jgi:hypothetical protein
MNYFGSNVNKDLHDNSSSKYTDITSSMSIADQVWPGDAVTMKENTKLYIDEDG